MDWAESKPVKRETRRQGSYYNMSAGNLDPDEEAQVKRRRLFDEIISLPVTAEPDPAAALIDGLSDSELRECYKIAEAALAAQFEDRKMSADVMEEFLQLVFEDWNPENDRAPGVEMLNDFPIKESFHEFTCYVGSINLGGKVHDVVRSIRMEIDPPRLIVENMQWNPTGKGNMNLEPLKGTDHKLVIWKEADHIRKVTKECYLIILVEVVGEVSEYNRQRAIAYARNFLGQQGVGDTTSQKRKYTFANLQGILNRLPLLTGQSIYKGDETVVLFGMAELKGIWEGTLSKVQLFRSNRTDANEAEKEQETSSSSFEGW